MRQRDFVGLLEQVELNGASKLDLLSSTKSSYESNLEPPDWPPSPSLSLKWPRQAPDGLTFWPVLQDFFNEREGASKPAR